MQGTDYRHHEQKQHIRTYGFARDVKSMSTTIEEIGNPFCESSTDLLVLDSRNIVDSVVVDTILQIEKLSLELYGVCDLLPKLCQSLIQLGVLRTGTQWNILHCLQDLANTVTENGSSPTVQVNILGDTCHCQHAAQGHSRIMLSY